MLLTKTPTLALGFHSPVLPFLDRPLKYRYSFLVACYVLDPDLDIQYLCEPKPLSMTGASSALCRSSTNPQ
jgi:hypothetical protein